MDVFKFVAFVGITHERINMTLIFNLGLVRHAKPHPKFSKYFIVGF